MFLLNLKKKINMKYQGTVSYTHLDVYKRQAFAYKMKLDAMKRQGSRTDITSGQIDQKLKPVISRNILADQVGESSKQIQRYIRLTELCLLYTSRCV